MRLRPPQLTLPTAVLLSFGVAGAPLAWAAQHVAGFAITQAACNAAGRTVYTGIPVDALTLGFAGAATATALLALAASVKVFRETRDAGSEPPRGRVHFLATVGMTIAPLFLLIIVMSGLGATFLENCVQG